MDEVTRCFAAWLDVLRARQTNSSTAALLLAQGREERPLAYAADDLLTHCRPLLAQCSSGTLLDVPLEMMLAYARSRAMPAHAQTLSDAWHHYVCALRRDVDHAQYFAA